MMNAALNPVLDRVPPGATAALLLAAGRSQRMQGACVDKICHPLQGGLRVFDYVLRAFEQSGVCTCLAVVYGDKAQKDRLEQGLPAGLIQRPILWVPGGDRRQDSVALGLEALAPLKPGKILIHDAARPLVRPDQIRALVEALDHAAGAALASPATDTLKRTIPLDKGLFQLQDLDRSTLWAMQTPQAFDYNTLRQGYQKAEETGVLLTDDTAALELLGLPVRILENPYPNIKVTYPQDLTLLRVLLEAPQVNQLTSQEP